MGILLGGLLLWALISLVIVPGEMSTVRTLARVEMLLRRHYVEHGRFPKADENGHLRWKDLMVNGEEIQDESLITNGFGDL